MDEQERYYKTKNEQLSREQHAREQAHMQEQISSLTTMGLYAAVLIGVILFFMAPGLLIQTVVLKTTQSSVTNEQFWVTSIAIDLGVVAILCMALGFKIRTLYAFLGLCVVSALLCFYVKPDGTTNVAHLIFDERVATLGEKPKIEKEQLVENKTDIQPDKTDEPIKQQSVDEKQVEQPTVKEEPKEEIIETEMNPNAPPSASETTETKSADVPPQAEKASNSD